MGGNRVEMRIEEIALEMGDAPFGSNLKTVDYTDSGALVVQGKNVQGRNFDWSDRRHVSHEKWRSIKRSHCFPGDLIFPKVGTIGKVGILSECPGYSEYLLSTNTMRLRVDPDKADPSYVYYFFTWTDTVNLIHALNSKSVQPVFNFTTLKGFTITVPPLDEQRAIGIILKTLDDKIELNRRMNKTLEGMARALFKSWFVDFDPVRAKMDGRWKPGHSLPGLPAHLYDLFPNKLTPSELGEIPEVWEVKALDESFSITMGQSPPGSTYNEDGIGLPFFQGRRDFGWRYPSRRVFCSEPKRIANPGDTLITVRAPVGSINMALEKCCVGRGVATARHFSGSRSYTYYFMRSLSIIFDSFEAEGTVFGSLGKEDFHSLKQVKPEDGVIDEFESIAKEFDSRIRICEGESRTLAALRDTLLPKLISGELRIKDAEKFVEDVA